MVDYVHYIIINPPNICLFSGSSFKPDEHFFTLHGIDSIWEISICKALAHCLSLPRNCESPTPITIEPTTILCAMTRNRIKYRLVVIAGPRVLYEYTPYPNAPSNPQKPIKRKIFQNVIYSFPQNNFIYTNYNCH